jgi:hypothetical protein
VSRDADQLKLRALAEKQLNREVRVAFCAAADEIERLQAVEAAFERLRRVDHAY